MIAAFVRIGSEADESGREGLYLWEFETGRLRGRLKDYTGTGYNILDMAFSPDEKTLGVQLTHDSMGDRIDLWTIPTQTKEKSHNIPEDTLDFDYSSDGTRVASASSGVSMLLNVATSSSQAMPINSTFFFPLTGYLPDGKRLAIYNNELASIWDISSFEEVALATGDTTNDSSAKLAAHPSLIQAVF